MNRNIFREPERHFFSSENRFNPSSKTFLQYRAMIPAHGSNVDSTRRHLQECSETITMDEDDEVVGGYMANEIDADTDMSPSPPPGHSLPSVDLTNEDRLVRRLSEVDRVQANIANELEKEHPCEGTVSRELLELEMDALCRDRWSIEKKLSLISVSSPDASAVEGEMDLQHVRYT